MEAIIIISVGVLTTALVSLCLWALIVVTVLTVMRFNAWAAGVERQIKLSRGRTY